MASVAARVMLLLCTLLPGALYASNGALGEIFAGHYAPDTATKSSSSFSPTAGSG
jgi:hypothetical protein